MPHPPSDIDELQQRVREGDRTSIGRALTLVESHHADDVQRGQDLLTRLLPHAGGAQRVGVSGVPGVGKSTFIENLGCRLLDKGHRVAVLAVDPSSTVSKGSILGDKTRMEKLATSERAFVRPSPTGGSLGGVARRTRESIVVCEAAGYDIVLVETVGVGQSETAVAGMVDFFLLLVLAGAGDELQGIKRGILELADCVVVNKADGDNVEAAENARATLERALSILRPAGDGARAPKVVAASGRDGTGLDSIWKVIEEHRAFGLASGELERRRHRQLLGWMWELVDDRLRTAVRNHEAVAATRADLEREVLEGRTTAVAAAEKILEVFNRARTGS